MSVPDYALEETIDFKFTSRSFSTGIPTTLAGTPAVEVYEDNGLTQITAAETLTVDFDGVTGLNNLRIVATSANGFEAGKSYQAVISAGTVGGVSVVGEVVAQFSIQRSPVNWANVTAPTTTVDLSATDIQLCDTVTTNTDMRGTDSAYTGTPPTATQIVDEWETQSQADPTGFHVNVLEWKSGAVATPTITGVPEVDITHVLGGVAAGSVDLGAGKTYLAVNLSSIEGQTTTVANFADAFDGTGYDLGGIDVSVLNTAATAIGSDGTGLTEAGGDGDHLTAINLPDQTMNITGNITGNLSGSVGSVSGVTFPTNFADLAIAASTGYVTVGGFLGAALTETTGGRIAGNFDTFFENADAATSKTVNDVGVAGSGLTAQTVWEYGTRTLTSGGGGSSNLLQTTTIATLTSQSEFTLTAGSADSNAYEGALVIITDQATSTQKAVSRVLNYVGSTKTLELVTDPNVFTMAVGDTVDIIATDAAVAPGARGTVGWLG